MFRIKICGITNVDDALAAISAGADAIGLNFYEKSRRFIAPRVAKTILAELPHSVLKAGVFVNDSAGAISDVVNETKIGCVQLHGNEPAAIIDELPPSVQIMRAFRCGALGLVPAIQFLFAIDEASRGCDAFLIDSDAGAEYGGTGQRADWNRIKSESFQLCGMPIVLAGGLSPENVAEAIRTVRPNAVDVASGVESSPGKKDQAKLRDFITAARDAFVEIADQR